MRYLKFGMVALATIFLFVSAEKVNAKAKYSSSLSCVPGSIKAKLGEVRRKFGRIKIISTYRRGARIAGSRRASYHRYCRAVDFNPPRGKYWQVAKYLKRTWRKGGIGTYSGRMNHIHIDNSGRLTRWHKGGKSRKKYRKHRHKKRAAIESKNIVLASATSADFARNFDRVSKEIAKLQKRKSPQAKMPPKIMKRKPVPKVYKRTPNIHTRDWNKYFNGPSTNI